MPTKREQPNSPDFLNEIQNHSSNSVRPASGLNISANPNATLSRDYPQSEMLYMEECLALYEQIRQLRGEDQVRLPPRANQPTISMSATTHTCLPECLQTCGFCGMLYHRCQLRIPHIMACNNCCNRLHSCNMPSDSMMDLNTNLGRLNISLAGSSDPHSNAIQQLEERRQIRSITNKKSVSQDSMNSLFERVRLGQDISKLSRNSIPNNGHEDGVQDIFSRVDHFNVASVDGNSAPKRKNNHKKLVINSKVRRSTIGHAKKFGQYGNNPGELSEPSGVATNNHGEILVVDSNNRRINIYNGMGEHLRSIEGQDPNSTSVMFANRIAICPISGNIIITERPPTKVGKILSPCGMLLKKFGEGIIEHPRGLAVDNMGRILVLQSMVGRVDIFTRSGEPINSFQLAMDFPFSIATNKYEEIFVADNKKHVVKVYDYDGNHLRDIGGEGVTNFPVGVNIGKNDEVVVCDNHNNFNITIFDREGNPIVGLKGEIKHTQCYGVTLTDNYEIILCSKDYEVCKYQIEPRHLDRSNQLLFYKGENEADDDETDANNGDFNSEYVQQLSNTNNANSNVNSNSGHPIFLNNGTSSVSSNDHLQARFREMVLSGRSSSLGVESFQRHLLATSSGISSPTQPDSAFLVAQYAAGPHLQVPQSSEGQDVMAPVHRSNARGPMTSVYDLRSHFGEQSEDRMMQFRAPGGPVTQRQQTQSLFGPLFMPQGSSHNPVSRTPGNMADSQSRFSNFRGPR